MKKLLSTFTALAMPLLMQAAETAIWNTANNTVTYANSVSGVTSAGATLDFSKFNSASAAAAEGQAGAYTLTRVVLSIDGSISATFRFMNSAEDDRNVASAYLINNPGFSLTAGGNSATEAYIYSDPATPFVVAGGETVNHSFNSSGTGLAQTDIVTGLAAYTGDDKLSSAVSLGFQIGGSFGEDVFTALKNSLGSADVSVTYYYDFTPVPEPTCLALVGLGCAALLARRRRAAA